ncbi:MAG: PilZ domain-containing protein [Acidobacteriota bacterium]
MKHRILAGEPSEKRGARRFIPLEPVSAVLMGRGSSLGQGIVSNISRTGACLVTNAQFSPHEPVRLLLRDRRRGEIFDSEARTVWSAEGMEVSRKIVGVLVGVSFGDGSPFQREKLQELLDSERFYEIRSPRAAMPRTSRE